jgi:hypothetical protein
VRAGAKQGGDRNPGIHRTVFMDRTSARLAVERSRRRCSVSRIAIVSGGAPMALAPRPSRECAVGWRRRSSAHESSTQSRAKVRTTPESSCRMSAGRNTRGWDRPLSIGIPDPISEACGLRISRSISGRSAGATCRRLRARCLGPPRRRARALPPPGRFAPAPRRVRALAHAGGRQVAQVRVGVGDRRRDTDLIRSPVRAARRRRGRRALRRPRTG